MNGAARDPRVRRVSRASLEGRVEPFLLRRMDAAQAEFAVQEVRPALSWNRLDLAFKLIWLESAFGTRSAFAEAIYAAHIAAFSLGDMREPGAERKDSLQAFTSQFRTLAEAIASRGFDESESLVPLARDGTILNGAHRAAAALFHDRALTAVVTGLEPIRYDFRYFRKRGMSDAHLEATALKYVERSPTAAIALLWPAAGDDGGAVERLLGPLVYETRTHLTPNGARNLLSQVYAGEPWLGPAEKNHPGIDAKLVPCFSGNRPLRVLMFDIAPGRDLIALKDEVREVFGIGKHSIHITDTHAEAVAISRLLLNRQSLHFLDHARPNRFPETARMAQGFRAGLLQGGADPDRVAVETGMVLGAYGLRPAGDVDFLAAGEVPAIAGAERHEAALYPVGLGDLLQDPAYHFHFWGLKFVGLDLVAEMKRRRNAGRDAEDLALIGPLLAGRPGRSALESLRYRSRFAYSRLRRTGIRLLDRVGLKERARSLLDGLRRASR